MKKPTRTFRSSPNFAPAADFAADAQGEIIAQFFLRSRHLGHLTERVIQTANHLAARLIQMNILNEYEAEALRLGAVWQDVGLLTVPTQILLKSSPFTLAEKRLLENHVEESCRLAEQFGLPPMAIKFIAAHHEQVNGGGYPQGLQQDEIPLGAQLLHLVNDYCLLQTDLSIRPAVRSCFAWEILEQQVGKKYSPRTFEEIFLPALGDFDLDL